jgi:hypothetical protein
MGLDNVKAIIVLSPLDIMDRTLLSLLNKMDKKSVIIGYSGNIKLSY